MKLGKVKSAYLRATTTLSNRVHVLSLAGFAVVWLLADQHLDVVARMFIAPLLFFVATIVADVAQYYWLSIAWGMYQRLQHNQGAHDGTNVEPPRFIERTGEMLFLAKPAFLLCGYCWVGLHLLVRAGWF